MDHRASVLAIATLVWMQAASASAYTIQTGLTEGCHERMIVEAFASFVDDPAWDEVIVPQDDMWRKLAHPLNGWMRAESLIDQELSEQQLFVLFSLVVGVRAPDTDGGSTSDLATQRAIHTNPRSEAQYVHSLRAPQDDEPGGSEATVSGTRTLIRRSFTEAVDARRGPIEAQIATAQVTLDFYDAFRVEVWKPAFVLGEAAHTLQDSFAHSVRSEEFDFEKIVHVLNYVDAIYEEFDESRDGIAHSRHLDKCDAADIASLRQSADLATEDLIAAFLEAGGGLERSPLEDVLDRWITLQEGCTFDNDFCDNASAIAIARKDPSDSILPDWMTCSAQTQVRPGRWVSVAGILLMLLFARRLRRL